MSTGKLLVQSAHAAVGASELAKKENHRVWRQWRNEGGKKVALEVESLNELEKLKKKADILNVVNIIIQDAGLTEVPPGTVTALGLGPDISERIDRITGLLPLFK